MASQPVPMGRYWADASDLFFRRPVLWLPVLVVDLAGSGLNLLRATMANGIAMRHLEYHSALGGTVRQRGFTPEMAQQAVTQITAVTWVEYLLRILLYVAAFVVTAALVWKIGRRGALAGALQLLRERASDAVFLALRALAVYAFATLANSYLTRYLMDHNSPLLKSTGLHVLLAVVVQVLLVAAMSSAALKLLVGEMQPSEHGVRSARVMALLLALASTAMSWFVAQSSVMVLRTTEGRRIALEMLASLVTAVPYILMFIGFGIIAASETTRAEEITRA